MNDSERTICEYLRSLHIGDVRYEPDGNVPPDFLIDARIAVEARRLNEHEEVGGGHRGLEVTAIPLRSAIIKSLNNSGPPVDSRSWFMHYSVRRQLPPWREVKRSLHAAVQQFRNGVGDPPREIRLGLWMRLRFHPASKQHSTLLLLGGSSDHDAGGLVVAELASNLQICIAEKSEKVASFRQRYVEWWLAFEDRIAYGYLDANDVRQLREALGPVAGFDKVILVNPQFPTKGIEVYSTAEAAA